MVDVPSPPPPPNPFSTAAAQTASNRETAVTQFGLGATNQVTPQGTLAYDQIGVWADGTPRFQATTALSPQAQGNVDQLIGLQGQFGDVASTQLDRVGGAISQPFSIQSATNGAPAPDPRSAFTQANMPDPRSAITQTGMPHATDWNAVPGMANVSAPDPNSILPERQRIEQALFDRVNPQLDRQRDMLETRLVNQGLVRGTEAFNTAMDEQARAENDMRLGITGQGGAEQARLFGMMSQASQQGFDQEMARRSTMAGNSAQRFAEEMGLRTQGLNEEQAQFGREMGVRTQGLNEEQAQHARELALRNQLINEALTERRQPYSEISTIMTGAQPAMPSFQGTPQPQVSGTNIAGLINDAYRMGPLAQYNAQQQSNNAMMGGLAGIGGSLLGGWAMSDKRLKKDIKKVGKTAKGDAIYKYRMKGSPMMQLGLMAQEVEKRDPKAVAKTRSGYKAVNYDRALGA